MSKKAIIWVLMVLVLCSFAYAAIDVSKYYHSLDDNLDNYTGVSALTNNGGVFSNNNFVWGNASIFVENQTGYVRRTLYNGINAFCIQFWINYTYDGAYVLGREPATNRLIQCADFNDANAFGCRIGDGTDVVGWAWTSNHMADSQWHSIAVNWSANQALSIYIDGVYEASSAGANVDAFNIDYLDFGANAGASGVDAWFDEISWTNAVCTVQDILDYNNSNTSPYVQNITIYLTSPANNTNSTSGVLNVSFSAGTTDSSNGTCQLFINGTLNASISFTDGVAYVINSTELGVGSYAWFLECNTSTISSVNTSVYNYYTDSVVPSCNFSASIITDVGEENYTFDVVCSDEHFFSLNVSCPASGQSFSITGLDVASYTFNQSFYFNVTDTCSFRYCDGHTAASLVSNWEFIDVNKPEDNSMKYEIVKDSVSIGSLWAVDGEFEFEQLKDKVKFKVKFGKPDASRVVYYQASNNSVYLSSNEFMGWIVDSASETWLDMNNALKTPVITINRGSGLWEFRLLTSVKEIEFESAGELNCVSGSFAVKDEFDYALETAVCPSTDADVSLLWLVLCFSCFLVVLGLVFRLRFLGLLGSIVLIPLSWTVIACHYWAGCVMFAVGLLLMLFFSLKK